MSEEENRESTFHKDLYDILIEAVKTVDIKKINGEERAVEIHDNESIYWSTRQVNSMTFARYVRKIKELERLKDDARNNMMPARAKIIEDALDQVIKGHRHTIDSKSSESIKDKNNTQATLVSMFAKHRTDRTYSAKDAGRGFLRSLMHKDEEENN